MSISITNFNSPALSGTYNPSLTLTSNLASASAPNPLNWMRISKQVHVSGRLLAQATAAGTCQLDLSLPFSSVIAVDDFSGNGILIAFNLFTGVVFDNTANNPITAQLQWVAVDALNHGMRFSFDYKIEP